MREASDSIRSPGTKLEGKRVYVLWLGKSVLEIYCGLSARNIICLYLILNEKLETFARICHDAWNRLQTVFGLESCCDVPSSDQFYLVAGVADNEISE